MKFSEILGRFAQNSNMSDSEFSMLRNELQETTEGRAYIKMNSEIATRGITTNPDALFEYAMDCLGTGSDEGTYKGIHAFGFALSNGLSGEKCEKACYALAKSFTHPMLSDLVKNWGEYLANYFKINIFKDFI